MRWIVFASILLSLACLGPVPTFAKPEALLSARSGAAALIRGKYDQALASYVTALKSERLEDYERAYILNDRGVVHWRLRRLQAAVADFNQAIELYPEFAEAFNNRGLVLSAIGLPEEALADFRRAVLLAPRYAAAYNNHGNALYTTSSYQAALKAFGKAIALMPSNAVPYVGRGKTQVALGRPFAAMRELNRALALNPRSMTAYRARGDAFLATRNYGRAIADYSQAITYAPKEPRGYLARAGAYTRAKKYKRAVRDLNKVVELGGRRPEALELLGFVKTQYKDYSGANTYLTQAIELDPKNARALVHRARALMHLGSPGDGLNDINKAISALPASAEALNIRAEIHEALGKRDEAIADFRLALTRDPENANGQTGLKRLTGEAPKSPVTAQPLGPATDGWVVTRVAPKRYVATHPDYPKVRARPEMYGPGVPEIMAWTVLNKPVSDIGLLRYFAGIDGSLDTDSKAKRTEYVAIVDLRRNGVVAIEPYRWGARKATWKWTPTAVVVTDPDGLSNEVRLRKPRVAVQHKPRRKSVRRKQRTIEPHERRYYRRWGRWRYQRRFQ